MQILTDVDIHGRTITWNQYATTVKSVATGLRQAGFQDQDCAALLSDNDIYFYVLGDAVIAAGGVFGAMQTSAKPAEIQHQLQVAAVKWLFVSPRYLSLALETAKEAGLSEANIFVFDPPGTQKYAGPRNCMSRLLETDGKGWLNPNVGKDPHGIMAYRMFSSGTTVCFVHIILFDYPYCCVLRPSLPSCQLHGPHHHITYEYGEREREFLELTWTCPGIPQSCQHITCSTYRQTGPA